MVRLTELPLVVIFWASKECPHCIATHPRWQAIAQSYASCLPSAKLDVADYEAAANTYRVKMLPTLMILRFGRASWRKLEGEATSEQIQEFYAHAAMGLDCALDDDDAVSDKAVDTNRPGTAG